MRDRAEASDRELHRRLGIELFNKTWTLMQKSPRTASDDDELVHCAHASAYHWLQVGTAANRARGEWQCSRVHAILGHLEPALWHARRCLELVETAPGEMEDWDLAAAHEALARAHLAAGSRAEAHRHVGLGLAAAAQVADAEDRAHVESDLEALAAELVGLR